MSSILKKLMAFAMLLIAAGHLKAQVPGRAPVKKINPVVTRPMTPHSYSWYKADLQKRYPQLNVPVTKQAPLSAARAMHGQPTYAQTRQNLLQRYPQLQQQVTMAAPGRTLSTRTSVLPARRSVAYYRQLVQQQVEKARNQAEQNRMRSQPVQPQIQQNPVQNLPVQDQIQQPRKQTVQPAPQTMQNPIVPASTNQ